MKIFFYALLLGMTLSISVHATETRAIYNAYAAGMPIMSGIMKISPQKESVFIQTQTHTRGLLSFLLDAHTILTSRLTPQQNALPLMQESTMESLTKGKIKKRQVNFSDKPKTLDYQTAIFDLMQQSVPMDKEYVVFDGKRKLKFNFNYQGIKEIYSSKKTIYSGPADYYTLNIEVLEGKKNGWFFKRVKDAKNPPLHLYFANIQGEKQKRLVRGEFDTTLLGTIVIYLSDLSKEI